MSTPTRRRRAAAGTVAAAFAFSGLVALGATPAQAEAFDPSCNPPDPAIKSLKISPTKVNVKTGKRTVVVSGTTTGPALTSAFVEADPVGKGVEHYGTARPKGNSFSVKVVVPKGAGKGRHNISLSLASADGGAWYEASELAAQGLPSSFNVISKPDLAKPTIKKIKLSTKKVNTTKKSAKVKVTATLADKGGSGLDYAYVEISNGPGDTVAVLKKKKGKWVGTAVFPKWAGKKKATVVSAAVRDVAGNSTTYGGGYPGAKKLTKALKPGFKVVSKSDRKAPTVGSVAVTPSTAKVGDRRVQVKFSIKASDAQSGVHTVDAKLVRRGGDYPYTIYGYLLPKKGAWTGTATVYCYTPGGTYDVEVESYDRVGNKSVVRKGSVTFTE